MAHTDGKDSVCSNAVQLGAMLLLALALVGLVFAATPAAGQASSDAGDATNVSTFELRTGSGNVVAELNENGWSSDIPAIAEPPARNPVAPNRSAAMDLTVYAEDANGTEIDLGGEYEVGAEPVNDSGGDLLTIDERGDSVRLDGSGQGQAELTFHLRSGSDVVYETPSTTVDVDVPTGVRFLAEERLDNEHACFHGDYDLRYPLHGTNDTGSAQVVNETHRLWNVTYDRSGGYVTFDAASRENTLDSYVFYMAEGYAQPVDGDVLERGDVDRCPTIEEYVRVETPEDGQFDFHIASPDDSGTTTAANDFAGIVSDDEPLPVSASGLTDTDGNLTNDDNATVQLVRDGTVLAETTDVSIENGTLSTSIDTETIDPGVEPDPATVSVVGTDPGIEDRVELVHEAHSLEEGFNQASIPQPAVLHTEGVGSIEQWNTSTESYVSLGANYDAGDVVDSARALHRGLYVDANSDGRIGYRFETDAQLTPGDVELANGWHLASSNFALDAGAGTRTLDADLVNVDVGGEGITVFDDHQSGQFDGSSTVGAFDSYWLYVEDPERNHRGIVTPTYDASNRSSILEATG